jgi:hypothetical protein
MRWGRQRVRERRVDHLARAGKKLSNSPKKLGNGRVEGLGKSEKSRDGQILLAALDRANIRAVESGDVSELFL